MGHKSVREITKFVEKALLLAQNIFDTSMELLHLTLVSTWPHIVQPSEGRSAMAVEI